MNFILFDTDVLIDHLRGVKQATEVLKESQSLYQIVISTITLAEIEAGLRESEREIVKKFLNFFQYMDVTESIAKKAGEYKRIYNASHKILLPDALIAATAFSLKSPLYTLNNKHYPMSDITVHVPYKK